MDLEIKYVMCMHCHSTETAGCLWVEGEEGASEEHWTVSEKVDPIQAGLGVGFADADEFKILLKCSRCGRYSRIGFTLHDHPTRMLPFGKEKAPRIDVVLECDPQSQGPVALHVEKNRLDVVRWECTISADTVRRAPPFYPYPLGKYRLWCHCVLPGGSIVFQCETSAGSPILIRYPEPVDLQAYRFSIDWATDEGWDYLVRVHNEGEKARSEAAMRDISTGLASKGSLDDLLSSCIAAAKNRDVPVGVAMAAASARACQAYHFLSWLEGQGRAFVWALYVDKYRPVDVRSKWWKGCFDAGVIKNIESVGRKRRKLAGGEEPVSPIELCDFDDLMTLIEKEWAHLLRTRDVDLEAVQGHFRYMKSIRDDVAHSRRIGHDALLELQENAARWCGLLGVPFATGEGRPAIVPVYSKLFL